MTENNPTPEKQEQPQEIVELFGKKFIKKVSTNGRIELIEIGEDEGK